MKLHIDKYTISFNGDKLRYKNEYVNKDVLLSMLELWSDRMNRVSINTTTVYFPFSLDDEYLYALEAHLDGEAFIFYVVHIDAIGFEPDGSNDEILLFINLTKPVVKRYKSPFLSCSIVEFRSAIINAVNRLKKG